MESLTLYSSVKTGMKKKLLFRGIALATVGALLFLISGAFLQERILGTIGLPLFLFVGSLVALGMVPYRKLLIIETKPHKIVAEEDKTLSFFLHGKQMLSLSRKQIDRIAYFEKPLFYGIAIHLKKEKETHFHPKMNVFSNQIKREYQCDLFLPYFSQHSFDSLYQFQFSKGDELE